MVRFAALSLALTLPTSSVSTVPPPAHADTCPFSGIGHSGEAYVADGGDTVNLLPGIDVDLYEHPRAPLGSAVVEAIPGSAAGAQRIALTDATLTVDVSGARKTRIWYDTRAIYSDEMSLQLDAHPAHYEYHLIVLPESIGGARVFHSYDPTMIQKGVIDLVGDFDQLRIGGQELAIESICAGAYTCDSVDASLAPPLSRGVVSRIPPRTWCVEVEVLAPDDRILESVTFEDMRRTFHDVYSVSAVVYEVDANNPGQGTLVASSIGSGGGSVVRDPLTNLRRLTGTATRQGKDSQGNPIDIEFLTTGDAVRGIPPVDVVVAFGETVLESGKTYRIGLGWDPGPLTKDYSNVGVGRMAVDRASDAVFAYTDDHALFAVTGAYRSSSNEYPTVASKWNTIGEHIVPRVRIQSRCP